MNEFWMVTYMSRRMCDGHDLAVSTYTVPSKEDAVKLLDKFKDLFTKLAAESSGYHELYETGSKCSLRFFDSSPEEYLVNIKKKEVVTADEVIKSLDKKVENADPDDPVHDVCFDLANTIAL